jgi:hypothetical protein
MKFNAFEGGRRILYLTMALYAITVGFVFWNNDPYPSMTFMVRGPNSAPVYAEGIRCETDNASESLYPKFAKGKTVSVTLCFKSVGEGSSKYIPYALDPMDAKLWLVNEKYSSEVRAYTERIKGNFVLSAVDKERAEKLWRDERNEGLKTGAMWLFGGLAVLWFSGAVVGWIVRGFAGIPQGKDSRLQ